jgi:hypothetical protein
MGGVPTQHVVLPHGWHEHGHAADGAVALVREYLRKKKKISRPGAALLKALADRWGDAAPHQTRRTTPRSFT